jgi:serralysin
MCYDCLAHDKGTSWASFSHDSQRAGAWLQLQTGRRNDAGAADDHGHWASLAQGAPLWGSITSWFSSATSTVTNMGSSAYGWLSDNISGLPLGVFSAAAAGLPNVPIFGTKYYAPTHIDKNVLALFSGSQWANNSVSYSFPDSRWDYELINPSASGFAPLSYTTQEAYRHIFEGYSPNSASGMKLTNIEAFTNLNLAYAGRDNADVKISSFIPGTIINRSHGFYPGSPLYGGDTWIQNGHTSAPTPDSYQYYVLLHEIGHALGLKHSHETGGNLPRIGAAYDSTEYTVMSYNVNGLHPQTMMMYDIAALQEMYGADFGTNSGNTVYQWDGATGETLVNGVRQGTPGANKIFLTIWDGGGTDTYDMSNYSGNSVIDLTPGGHSLFSAAQRAGYAKGNVYNALQYKGDARSLIENAIAGAGNDKIVGNNVNNVLSGNGGNDTLYGGKGHDVLKGGAGSDIMYGEDGNDTIDGGDNWDYMWGGDGNDVIAGHDGGDWLNGDDGNDTLYGGADNDGLEGGSGSDIMYGEDGNDTIDGGDNWDHMWGGAGHDRLSGGGGDDRLSGGAGNDQMFAGEGHDVLDGEEDNDWLFGGIGWDYLSGSGGDDTLYGEGWNDSLVGGLGNDTLYGGADWDTFLFGWNSGSDVIKDFGYGDVIRLEGVNYSYQDAWGSHNKPLDQSGSGRISAKITTDDGRTILIEGVSASLLKGTMVGGDWEWRL